ncbi:MAG TPA: hypothetical protein VGZ04_04555 [Acidimicrobiales bacterium]|nr:hypothetical protein [Acidimicrobiales bacterium]
MSNLQSEIPDTESPDGTPLKTEVPDQPQSVDDVDDVEEFEEVEEVESVAVSPEQTEPIVVTAVTPETLEVPEIEEPLAHEDVPEKQQAPPDQETRVDDGDEVGAPNIELSHLLEEAPKPESSGKSSGHKKKKKKKHKKN